MARELSEELQSEIRAAYSKKTRWNDGFGYRDIAAKYGLSKTTAFKIVNCVYAPPTNTRSNKKTAVLEVEIVKIITANPGMKSRDIFKITGGCKNSVRYAIWKLREKKQIESHGKAPHQRHYTPGEVKLVTTIESDKCLLPVLRIHRSAKNGECQLPRLSSPFAQMIHNTLEMRHV